jgi:hypothetical protein
MGLRGAGVAGGQNIGAARGISGWLGRLILAMRKEKEVQAQLILESLHLHHARIGQSSETRRDRDYILARN